jgi:hypothetical protein
VIRDAYGCDPATCSIFTTNRAVAAATAALDAVGAWGLLEAARAAVAREVDALSYRGMRIEFLPEQIKALANAIARAEGR